MEGMNSISVGRYEFDANRLSDGTLAATIFVDSPVYDDVIGLAKEDKSLEVLYVPGVCAYIYRQPPSGRMVNRVAEGCRGEQ